QPVREGVWAQVRALDVVAATPTLPIERPRGSALGRFARKKPLGAAGGILVLLLVGTAVLADVLSTHDPVRTSTNVLVAPGADFWLGTDNLGRDQHVGRRSEEHTSELQSRVDIV